MTDEQINAAISAFMRMDEEDCYCQKCRPNYCNDLNAMHEAEKHIPDSITYIYGNKIGEVTGAEDSLCLSFYSATARQRAEAFLKTLGKWEKPTSNIK